MSGPENPTAVYIGVRVGRHVRIERADLASDIIGRLSAFDGEYLTIEEHWQGQPSITRVPFDAVRALWVRG